MTPEFIKFYEFFKTSDLWKNMEAVSENSPWHREANVAIHTNMTIDALCKLKRTDKEFNISAISLLFHDTGKPAARTERYKPERGVYYVYAGHEHISARIFEDFYMSNQDKFVGLLDKEDIYKVIFIIENHLPYAIEKEDKLIALRSAIHYNLDDMEQCFFDHLYCDNAGRISDNAEEKAKRTEAWIDMMKNFPIEKIQTEQAVNQPHLILLIAASGSGKSTFSKNLDGFCVHSLDECRLDFLDKSNTSQSCRITQEKDFYAEAFNYANQYKSEFSTYVNKDIINKLNSKKNVVVDNTNVARKSRATYIAEAKRRGYFITAVMFPIDKKTVVERQNYRPDKSVPIDAVLRQYASISVPYIGSEVNKIIVN